MTEEEKALEELAKVENLSAPDKEEYERIQAEIESCKKELERLEAGRLANYKAHNYRYVLDLDIPFQELPIDSRSNPTGTPLSYQTSTTVKKDTKFFCTHLECAVYATGTARNSPTQLSLAIRPYLRANFIQFEWAIRDTGSDRSWQNNYLPMGLLKTNRLNSLELGTNSVLSGGSEIFLDVNVQSMRLPTDQLVGVFSEIKKFSIQVSFCGYEVSEK